MTTLQDETNMVISVMKASTTGSLRALALGIIPILEFGAVIWLTLMVVKLPLSWMKKGGE
jgi:hypothetical protein